MQISFEGQGNKKGGSERKQKAFSEQIRRIVSIYIRQSMPIDRPIPTSITVTRVIMAKDLRQADVYIADSSPTRPALIDETTNKTTSQGVESNKKGSGAIKNIPLMKKDISIPGEVGSTIDVLRGEAGNIRHFISQNLKTKLCPHINFLLETGQVKLTQGDIQKEQEIPVKAFRISDLDL